MEVFFIGDTHFGHKNIITFDSVKPFRPFNNIEEHDEELVKRWNSVVGPKDIVWHLGDVCFGLRNLHHIGRCNGDKRLVQGNHDMYGAAEYLKYFTKIYGAVGYKGAILTHVPVHPCQLENRFYLNIHGHLHTNNVMTPSKGTHGNLVKDSRYVNVSCEQINLTPIPYDEVLNFWKPKANIKV